jgi:hypothetical protein
MAMMTRIRMKWMDKKGVPSGKSKQSRSSEKKSHEAMVKHGIKPITGVSRVTEEKPITGTGVEAEGHLSRGPGLLRPLKACNGDVVTAIIYSPLQTSIPFFYLISNFERKMEEGFARSRKPCQL